MHLGLPFCPQPPVAPKCSKPSTFPSNCRPSLVSLRFTAPFGTSRSPEPDSWAPTFELGSLDMKIGDCRSLLHCSKFAHCLRNIVITCLRPPMSQAPRPATPLPCSLAHHESHMQTVCRIGGSAVQQPANTAQRRFGKSLIALICCIY